MRTSLSLSVLNTFNLLYEIICGGVEKKNLLVKYFTLIIFNKNLLSNEYNSQYKLYIIALFNLSC